MSTMFDFRRDINSYAIGMSLPFAVDGYAVQVKSGTGASLTIPSNFTNWVVKITPGAAAEVWASNASISLPSGATPAASSAQIVPPDGLFVSMKSADTLYLASPSTPYVDVSIALYAINNFN